MIDDDGGGGGGGGGNDDDGDGGGDDDHDWCMLNVCFMVTCVFTYVYVSTCMLWLYDYLYMNDSRPTHT